MRPTARLLLSACALLVITAGLLYWVMRPAGTPPSDQLGDAAAVVGFLCAIAAGSGVAAMATVQFWKVLFLPRSSFHEHELRRLFGKEAFDLLTLAAPDFNSTYPKREERRTATLTYLLDNPTEVVMGQLRSVADYVLIKPEGFERTLLGLAGPLGEKSVHNYLSIRSQRYAAPEGQRTDAGFVNDALVEVRFFVEHRLNMVHVSLKERWRRQVRMIAVAVAGSSGLVVAVLSDLSIGPKTSAVFAAVVWGGFFSWLSRDLVALVERRRT